jgi:hypothetical protein
MVELVEMVKKQITFTNWLRASVLRVTRIHFLFVIAVALQIIVLDAGRVITPNIVLLRWLGVAVLAAVVSVVWMLAHNNTKPADYYKYLLGLLITADILFASLFVYLQRGMASRAVFLFAIPIVTSVVLLSRPAIFATAIACAAAYIAAAVSYFVLNFNEGYKIELYGEVGFYSLVLLLLAALLSAFVKFNDE